MGCTFQALIQTHINGCREGSTRWMALVACHQSCVPGTTKLTGSRKKSIVSPHHCGKQCGRDRQVRSTLGGIIIDLELWIFEFSFSYELWTRSGYIIVMCRCSNFEWRLTVITFQSQAKSSPSKYPAIVSDVKLHLRRSSWIHEDNVQNLHLNISVIESIYEPKSRGKEADNIAAPSAESSLVLASDPTLQKKVMVWYQRHTFELSYNGINSLLPLSVDRPFSGDVYILHRELPNAKAGMRVW